MLWVRSKVQGGSNQFCWATHKPDFWMWSFPKYFAPSKPCTHITACCFCISMPSSLFIYKSPFYFTNKINHFWHLFKLVKCIWIRYIFLSGLNIHSAVLGLHYTCLITHAFFLLRKQLFSEWRTICAHGFTSACPCGGREEHNGDEGSREWDTNDDHEQAEVILVLFLIILLFFPGLPYKGSSVKLTCAFNPSKIQRKNDKSLSFLSETRSSKAMALNKVCIPIVA